MSYNYKYGIFIGRFQPFHRTHYDTVLLALTQVENLIIIVGSANKARDIKNPWSAAERKKMIESSFSKKDLQRITILEGRDFPYNDNLWIGSIQKNVASVTGDTDSIALIGHYKDKSSFYLDLFPQWKFIETNIKSNLDATYIRELYFGGETFYSEGKKLLPNSVYNLLIDFSHTEQFKNLVEDYIHIQNYKKIWEVSPYPPTFVTSDSLVLCSGHVLVVKRKFSPGKGLLCLPGGFIGQDERILDSAIRELKEETAIGLSSKVLKTYLKDTKVFDHPQRSLRGRTITHGHFFDLGAGPLPKVRGGDDAEKAFWMPLAHVRKRETEFFEDHSSMIYYFVNRTEG